jgi:hypothetical protein
MWMDNAIVSVSIPREIFIRVNSSKGSNLLHIDSAMSEVTYIYKLVPLSAPIPDPLPEALPLSNLDSTDGFIHLSTAVQVPKTLKRFFADESKITVLRIKYATVEKDIKWESPDGKGMYFDLASRNFGWR